MLMAEKKKTKKEMEVGTERTEQLNIIKEKILAEEHEIYQRKLKKTCDEIRVQGKFSSGGFWKVVKKMKKKKTEEVHAVEDKEGNLLTSNDQIIKRYGEYFKDLLTHTTEQTKLEENKETANRVEEKFKIILE